MNIGTTVQSRVRQLLELVGGPPIVGIESVQPVVVVGQFWSERQPQLEMGDMLVRDFTAIHEESGMAANYSLIGIRVTNPRILLWIRRLTICSGVGNLIVMARSPKIAFTSVGTASYNDLRLPAHDIGASVAEVGGSLAGAFPGWLGRRFMFNATGSLVVDCSYILIGDGDAAGENLAVGNASIGEELKVCFEGIAFDRKP